MNGWDSVTFIRPEPIDRRKESLPAKLVNACLLLRLRSGANHAFVPIRSMQFQTVIDEHGVLFIDNQGGYATENGVGGRLVTLAWDFSDVSRDSLDGPVSIVLNSFRDDALELHRRILSEFPPALTAQLRKVPHPDGRGDVIEITRAGDTE